MYHPHVDRAYFWTKSFGKTPVSGRVENLEYSLIQLWQERALLGQLPREIASSQGPSLHPTLPRPTLPQ